MGSTLSTFASLLKEQYVDSDRVEELAYPENPLFAMLEKRGDTGMVGSQLVVPIFYANPQGIGSVFSTAQTNASNTSSAKFNIVAGDYYGSVLIGDKVLEASRTNGGAELENKMVEIDGLYEGAGENESIYCWGNGGNALGRISVIQNTNDVILSGPEQIANFEVGEVLVASANDGSDTSHTLRTGSATISAIQRSTGLITLNTVAGITSLAAGDYLFRQSDFFGDQSSVVIKGIQSFITTTEAPPALWGISANTRALDPQRFAGCRVPDAVVQGKTFEERIRLLVAYMTGRFKAKRPTAGWMHPEDFDTLVSAMASRGLRDLTDDSTQFGFAKIDVNTPSGKIPVYTDRHCPKGTFFALRMEDWWISSMGKLMHPQNGDGVGEILRKATSTDYEFRLISYPLLACRAPKNSGRVSLL